MANNVIKRLWNQNRMVTIEDLKGMTFQQEVSGHTFEITGVDDAGNIIALSGTPSGVLLRADDQEVALTCSVSDGKVYATIPANGYAVPGKFGLTVFLTASGQTTALYAAIGSVNRTASGIVAPPAGSDVATLINQINAAIAAIPANYNACFAPTYSPSGLYAVGQYVMNEGYLYRCTTAITTGETFTPAHWTQVALANDVSDLKSAFEQSEKSIGGENWSNPTVITNTVTNAGKAVTITPGYYKCELTANQDASSLTIYVHKANYDRLEIATISPVVNGTTYTLYFNVYGDYTILRFGWSSSIAFTAKLYSFISLKATRDSIENDTAQNNLLIKDVAGENWDEPATFTNTNTSAGYGYNAGAGYYKCELIANQDATSFAIYAHKSGNLSNRILVELIEPVVNGTTYTFNFLLDDDHSVLRFGWGSSILFTAKLYPFESLGKTKDELTNVLSNFLYLPSDTPVVKRKPSTMTMAQAEKSLFAIKALMLYNVDSSNDYYIRAFRKVQGGSHDIQIGHHNNGQHYYDCFWSKTYTDPNGLEWIALPEYQSSGVTGYILIDWSEVTEDSSDTTIGSSYLNINHIIEASKTFKEVFNMLSDSDIYISTGESIATRVPSGMTNEEAENSLKAIKSIMLTGLNDDYDYYFVRALQRVQNGIHAIQIGRSSGGVISHACYWHNNEYTDPNGLEWIELWEYQGSGVRGKVLIDWSEVTENSNNSIASGPLNRNHIIESTMTIGSVEEEADEIRNDSVYATNALLAAMVTSETFPQNNIEDISIALNLSHFICYGQSWACGASTSTQYVISHKTIYNNLMFKGGVRTWRTESADKYSSFIPLEETHTYWGYYESPVAGQCEMVKQLLATENAYLSPKYQLIGTAPGASNKSLAELSKGTEYYQYFMDAVTNAQALATTENKTYEVEVFSFINGTLDKAAMIQLQEDIDEDVKEITDQSKTVKMLTWQQEVHNANLDYYDAYVDIDDNVICVFPGYIIPHIYDGPNQSNNIHFTPEGSRIAGEYFGIAFKRIILDGENWNVLKPESVQIDENNLLVTFHVPVAPLKFDTGIVKSVSNYGFRLFTSGGTEKTISSVTIQGNDTIKIVCSSAIDSTDVLAYAYTPNESSTDPWGPENIARGNLCDSQKIMSLTGRNLANFCVAFKKPLSFWGN